MRPDYHAATAAALALVRSASRGSVATIPSGSEITFSLSAAGANL